MEDVHHLFHSFQQLSRQFIQAKNEALQPFGLYSAQWAIIYTLKTKGPLTQKDIGDYLSVEAPHITRTVKKLIEQGYCQSVVGQDKRTKYVQLTEVALADYPKWEAAVLAVNHQLLSNLSVDAQQELQRLIGTWLKQLS